MSRRFPFWRIAFCCVVLCLISCHGNQVALNSKGLQAARIERLWWFMFSIVVSVYLVVMAWLGSAILRSRTASSITEIPPQVNATAERRMTIVVGSAIGLTVVLLFVILISSVMTGHAISGLTSKNPVAIDIIGHQWWWEVRYEATQADQTVITANEIHIPVGQPVVIKTSSVDVIHSFWAPNLHGKRDLIPGYQNALWIQADQEGSYR
ncbi:MAG TPA: cytochrome c oxidase subunit II, partial [Candidatus Angelobacter sp.]|nr:cytochrome c oxidase subunit II [Candidatus Angelobacter sp.]